MSEIHNNFEAKKSSILYTKDKIFLTSLVFILFFIEDLSFRRLFFERIEYLYFIFIAIALSFYYVFTSKKTPDIFRAIIIAFGVTINGIMGIYASVFVMGSNKHLIIFPILNLASSFIMMIMIKERNIQE